MLSTTTRGQSSPSFGDERLLLPPYFYVVLFQRVNFVEPGSSCNLPLSRATLSSEFDRVSLATTASHPLSPSCPSDQGSQKEEKFCACGIPGCPHSAPNKGSPSRRQAPRLASAAAWNTSLRSFHAPPAIHRLPRDPAHLPIFPAPPPEKILLEAEEASLSSPASRRLQPWLQTLPSTLAFIPLLFNRLKYEGVFIFLHN